MTETLLDVRGLRLSFGTEEGTVRALFGVSFSVAPGETLGLVGESGCGKTITALSILKLLPSPPARIEAGNVIFRGRDLIPLPEKELCGIRGLEISMIFQEPMTSLNPVLTVGEQVAEVFTAHRVCGKREAGVRAEEWLRRVKMPDPGRRMREYPHQLSGGMRQRAMIAMALALEPALLIADEPTTALDVTIQAQILSLLKEMRKEQGMAILLITHDLGVVSEFADRTAIMYLGRIVEISPTTALFADPVHPYTQGLFRSLPGKVTGEKRLPSIPGVVPGLDAISKGCPFADRCPFRLEAREKHRRAPGGRDELSVCDREDPPLEEFARGHLAACHHQKRTRKGGAG